MDKINPDTLATVYFSNVRGAAATRVRASEPDTSILVGDLVALRRRTGRLLGVVRITQAHAGGTYSFEKARGVHLEMSRRKDDGSLADRLASVESRLSALNEDAIVARVRVAMGEPTRFEIVHSDAQEPVNIGIQHKLFGDVLTIIGARNADGNRLNLWIAGPAGSGKSKAVEEAAKALGLKFALTGAIMDKSELVGFIDAQGGYRRTEFREVYENGGVFCWDDVDRSDPQAFAAFNAALAGSWCAFPDGMVKRHADAVFVATANTWGGGATSEYVGAMRLDAATLDRFVRLGWDYDNELEAAICGDREVARRVQEIRARIRERGIKVLVTPRATLNMVAMLRAGMPRERAEELAIRSGMSDAQWTSVR
jgi:hypothetical protein